MITVQWPHAFGICFLIIVGLCIYHFITERNNLALENVKSVENAENVEKESINNAESMKTPNREPNMNGYDELIFQHIIFEEDEMKARDKENSYNKQSSHPYFCTQVQSFNERNRLLYRNREQKKDVKNQSTDRDRESQYRNKCKNEYKNECEYREKVVSPHKPKQEIFSGNILSKNNNNIFSEAKTSKPTQNQSDKSHNIDKNEIDKGKLKSEIGKIENGKSDREPTIVSWSPINKSRGEKLCGQILSNLTQMDFMTVRIEELKNPLTGEPLELDCYNEDLKLGLEYQGPQHYHYPNWTNNTLQAFKEQIFRDEYKRQKCHEIGISLIEVPYTIPTEELEEYILEKLYEHDFIVAEN